jgi:hypothetical protein
MSFSEMLEVLGVSSSFLNYHLENLGELLGKTDDGKYRLSSIGEAAMVTMNNVEDIPAIVLQQSQKYPNGKRTSNPMATKIVRKTTLIALGIICTVLIAGLAGTIIVLNNANLKITNLQSQITSDNAMINASSSIGNTVISDPSAWVNRTVMVEGNISFYFSYFTSFPWNYQLSSNGATIGVSWQGNSDFLNGANWTQLPATSGVRVLVLAAVHVLVLGVVTEGQVNYLLNGTHTLDVYFIEAETIEPL